MIRTYYVTLKSNKNFASTGEVKGIEQLTQIGINGKNVLLVEDMIDSGTTMKAVLNKIKANFSPKTLRTAVAFHRMNPMNVEWGYFADYTGFLVENSSLAGYGMDYNNHFRDLPHLCMIN